jgi:predicted Zn-dependent peptidase
MAQNETHFGRYVPLEEIIHNIDAVTEDDILHLAEDLFQDNRFSMTLLGPVDDKNQFDDILLM